MQGRSHASKVGGSESGETRIEGAKRPRFEGEARIEGEAREGAGEGSGGGGSVSPSPENFLNFELQIVQSGVYLKPKYWFNRFKKIEKNILAERATRAVRGSAYVSDEPLTVDPTRMIEWNNKM